MILKRFSVRKVNGLYAEVLIHTNITEQNIVQSFFKGLVDLFLSKYSYAKVLQKLKQINFSQGEQWHKTRTIANPILMKPRNTVLYVPKIDEIAIDFINKRVIPLRDDKNEMPSNFADEFNKWALESISYIAVNSRVGVLDEDIEKNKDAKQLIEYIREFFSLVYQLDIEPSMWRYIKTPKFYKLMKTMDGINE